MSLPTQKLRRDNRLNASDPPKMNTAPRHRRRLREKGLSPEVTLQGGQNRRAPRRADRRTLNFGVRSSVVRSIEDHHAGQPACMASPPGGEMHPSADWQCKAHRHHASGRTHRQSLGCDGSAHTLVWVFCGQTLKSCWRTSQRSVEATISLDPFKDQDGGGREGG